MDIRVGMPKLPIVLLFLVLNPKIECQMILPPTPPSPHIQPACALLPFTQVPPPSPPNSPPPGHRQRHGHRHSEHIATPIKKECCRWLQEIDNDCICDMLVRLPVFLTKPIHKYTVMVDSLCNLSYTCSGRLISA